MNLSFFLFLILFLHYLYFRVQLLVIFIQQPVYVCDQHTANVNIDLLFEYNSNIDTFDISPVIFILVFNPIIQYLKLKEDRYGYKLNGNSVITLPYADDFNLITSNKRTHQRVINELHSITSSMNLKLKPEKCKNLSICSGSPKIVPFSLGGKDLDSIKDSPMKFLGACVSCQSTSMEGFTFIHNKLESMLKNIESTNIRPEFKVRIYTQYAMSSIRFALTVHHLTSTQRKSLDSLTICYLKSWLGMPKCGATSAIII